MRTRIVLLCCCVVSYMYSIAQAPVNDNCGSATPITTLDGSCVTGDVTNATEDIASFACSAGNNENVWFSFTAQGVSAEIQVNNGPGTPEITLVQFTGGACNPGGAVEIECIAGSPLLADNQLVVGTTYYVMVAFSNNADGTFDICIDNPPPAPNDACVTAQVLANLNNACITGDNEWPSTDVMIPGCFTGSTWNVWYSFTAVGVSLDLHIPSGPGVAQFAVIDFDTPCNITDAVVLGCATGTNHIVLDNVLTINSVYYVVVGFQNSDWDGNGMGDFELCIDNPIPAINDDCMDAIVIPTSVLNDPTTCFTSIAGNPLNNDWPSTDVGLFNCWNMGDSYNIWYSFVAQGPDVQVTVDPGFPQDAQIAVVDFTGNPCEFAGAQYLECANGTVLDLNDELIIGQTYYIAVGFEDNAIGSFCMNVFNPQPPPNDMPCNAITLGTNNDCEDGTTIYANPETLFWPPACQSSGTNVVWYEISLADPDNVGFTVDLDFEDINPGETVSVFLYPGTDCNNIPNPSFFYCGDPPTEPLEFGPVENIPYFLAIGTSEPSETDFEVCVDEIPPCFTNDICEEATVINGVTSDAPFVCVTGCNLFADPETFENGCGTGTFSTVWFQVPTDGNAALMNIFVNSEDFDAPTISLFWQTTDCSALTPVPMGGGNAPCIVGSGGEAQAVGSDVGANAIYYIAVSSLNSVGGEFELCVNTISAASLCVTSRDIEITGRSAGGSLDGPFFPGETVSVCLNVNSYTAANNGCQWFQGIIPVFGNGWDPSSFDADGQPSMNATVNGNAFGVASNGIYGTSTWDWFTDVDYHYDHFFYQLGDFDGNGTTDMCNLLYDPNCPNTGGLMGGCCNPCWGAPLGTILPGGWFAYGINGSCPEPGPPIRVDWGDGNTCGGGMGPWAFCFDLLVRDYPDCLEDPSTMDLKIGFFTTADGETGAWTGNASICALDQPAFVTLPMCCSELEEGFDQLDPICSEQQFVYSIYEDGVDFWQWTVDGGGTTGGLPGEGGPGTVIINTLTNNTGDVATVTYTFLGFAGGACPVFEKEVVIDVYPKIEVTFDPLIMCSTPDMPYVLAPNVSGGTGMYGYLWNPGMESTPSITIPNPTAGTVYTVSVTDDAGCFTTASIAPTVYTTFPVDIIAPVTEQCIQDGPITIEATATGGIDPYAFEWTLPGGSMPTTEEVITTETGQHLVVVTDEEGCVGKDSILITLNETPEVFIDAIGGILALCENQSTQLTGVATGGESPYIYEWSTPDGPESGKTITAYNPGTFTVTVEDANGCTADFDIAIEAQEEPDPDLGDDILVCNFEEEVELAVTEQFEDYAWSIGSAADGLQSIGVYAADTYTVTVTNQYGCTASDDIEVGTFPQPVFALPDTFEICPGSCVTVNADDFGGPWEYALWDQCPGCFLEFDVCQEGEYEVSVFDINGCSASQEFAVVETATLATGLTGDNVICVSAGESTTLSVSTGFAEYEWSPPGIQNTSSITVNAPGTYHVTVEDQTGCIGTDSLVVISGDFTAAISGPTEICAGVLATLTATPNFATYIWSTNEPTQTVQVDDGTHTVTVTNVDGCVSSASITIIETPFVPVITGENTICQTSDNTVLDAGPGQTYQWSANANNATTQTITTNAPGDYFVTVTDASGCVGTASFTVETYPVPFVAVTGNPDFCVGGDTEMSATGGYANYTWSNASSNDTIVINTPGLYSVTVTDSNGCTNTAAATVNPPYQETVSITGSFVFCPGGQATLAVPPGYQSVTWSTGESMNQIFVTTEGDVSVIVVDTDGCIAYDTVTTDANDVLSPQIVGPDVICDAGPGTLDAGPGFGTYAWCCGLGNNQTAVITAPGTYTVTVTDGSCTGTDDFVVISTPSPSAVVTPTASACNVQEPGGPTTVISFDDLVTGGDQNGIWAQVSGPGSVSLTNTGAVNFNGLVPGTYTFTYATNSAVDPCVDQSYPLTVTINDCSCPTIQLGLAPDLCNDLGSLDLNTLLAGGTQSGGTWNIIAEPAGSNPATLSDPIFNASNADPGTYTVEYSLSGLPTYCTDAVTIDLNVLPNPTAGTAAIPLQFCVGETQLVNLVTMLIGADAGGVWEETSQNMSTGGAFNPANGTFNIAGQAAGTYTFSYVLVGPGPCPDDMTTVEIVIENNPVADAGATATLNCNVTSTTLGGSGSSVGQDIVYIWTTVDGTVMNADQLYATATKGGTYVLTVMNTQTGCSAMDQVIIDQIGDFPTDIDLTVLSPDCEGDPPGSAVVNDVIGGLAPFMYSLNNEPPTSNPNFQNLAPGDYTMTAIDATGCDVEVDFTVFDLVNVDLNIINYVNDTLIFDFKDTITLSYEYIGSTAIPDSLVWKMGDSVLCIDCAVLEFPALLSGQITVEAYDVRGCFVSKTISYIVVRKRDVYIPNVFSPNGDNLNDYFTLFTDSDVKEITLMEIYTRWGDLVFSKANFQPNDPSLGWDGKFRDEFLNPGVYVYRIEILYGDDLQDKLAGDITIVR